MDAPLRVAMVFHRPSVDQGIAQQNDLYTIEPAEIVELDQ